MKLVTLLCVCVLITTGTWAYSRDCAKGPEYWCRDASTAKDCGAVLHCRQTAWRQQRKTDETAQMLCNVLVQASTELLADGSMNVNSIEQFLNKDCTKLPNQDNLIQKCELAVKIYLPDILRHIKSGTEATKICAVIQGHDISSVSIPKPKPLGITSNQTCVLCEFIIHLLDAFATGNKTAEELAQILEQVCQAMPEVLRGECKSFIETYGLDIIALLVREFDPAKICEIIKICPKPKNVAFLTKPNQNTCGLCDYVSTYLSAGYPIENVCKHFSTDNNLKEQCEILVHLYKPNFCSQLPLCFDDVVLQPVETTIASPECSLCKYIVNYIDNVIQNNKSAAAIEAALDKVCTILPEPIKTKCEQFIKTFGPLLAILIEKYNTSEQVCNALKACHNGTEGTTPREIVQMLTAEKSSIGSPECTLCKYIVGYIDYVIQNNKSAAAVEAALDKVCTILPEPIKTKCKQFIKTYGPLLAILIKKYNTSEQVCNALKACHNGTQEINPRGLIEMMKIKQSSVNSAECSLCKYIVSYIDVVIQTNKSEAAIDAALEKVCSILPGPAKTKCVQFVDTYGPILAQLIAKYATADQVCNALKLCNNGTQVTKSFDHAQVSQLVKSAINSAECSLCKYIVSYIDAVIQNNKSEAAIEATLKKVCSILPSTLKTKCQEFVKTYGPLLVQLIEKYGTPAQVCEALKVCHNGTESLQPVNGRFRRSIENVKRSIKFGSIISSAIGSAECTLCKYIVGYIDNVIQNNKSAAAVEAALDKVCTILPAPIKTKCEQFIKTYGPLLAILIKKYNTSEQVCNALKACHNGTQGATPRELVQILKVAESSINSAECSLCKYVVSYIDAIIQNNKSEAAIEAALEKVCTILPASLKTKCDNFVKTYGPVLVQLIEKYGTPAQVCDALKVCHNGTESLQPVSGKIGRSAEINKRSINFGSIISSGIGSAECTLCKYIVGYIDNVIQNNRSEAAIEAALDKVCTILPAPIKTKCEQFIKTYGPLLAILIEKYKTSEQVCNALKACHNGTETVESMAHNIVESITTIKNNAECTLCKYVLSYIDVLISNNASAQELEKALEVVCSILPSTYHTQCSKFVQQYGPILAQLIAELDDPNVVCQLLSLCPKSDQKFIEIPVLKMDKLKTLPCNLCEYIVNYADAIIQSNSTETQFEELLDRACKILPETKLRAECQTIVHLYGADLIKLLADYGNPKAVCQAIGICDK